jgi:hypothetical protein
MSRSARLAARARGLCEPPLVAGDALDRAILDLGMEDDIPLWEIADDCRAAALIAAGPTGLEALAGALLKLARRGEIRILVGRWDDPTPRSADLDESSRAFSGPPAVFLRR